MTLDDDIEGKRVKIEKKVSSLPRDFNSLPISEKKKNNFFHKVLILVSSCRFGHFWLCAGISAVEPLLLELGYASSVWEKKCFFWTLTWWGYSKVKQKLRKRKHRKKYLNLKLPNFYLKNNTSLFLKQQRSLLGIERRVTRLCQHILERSFNPTYHFGKLRIFCSINGDSKGYGHFWRPTKFGVKWV